MAPCWPRNDSDRSAATQAAGRRRGRGGRRARGGRGRCSCSRPASAPVLGAGRRCGRPSSSCSSRRPQAPPRATSATSRAARRNLMIGFSVPGGQILLDGRQYPPHVARRGTPRSGAPPLRGRRGESPCAIASRRPVSGAPHDGRRGDRARSLPPREADDRPILAAAGPRGAAADRPGDRVLAPRGCATPRYRRQVALALIGLVSVVNIVSLVLLVPLPAAPRDHRTAATLIRLGRRAVGHQRAPVRTLVLGARPRRPARRADAAAPCPISCFRR